MEPVNKSGKGRPGRRKNKAPTPRDPTPRDPSPRDQDVVSQEDLDVSDAVRQLDSRSTQCEEEYTSALDMACLHGQLASIQLLLESGIGCIYASDKEGRRPIHLILSSRSHPNTFACLKYLLANGADVNVNTDTGMTPLHLAASEGFLDCTLTLVQAGADVLALDNAGHTPLDKARILCHRKIARYLKTCMWQKDKSKEMHERKLVQALYTDLVDVVKLNILGKKPLIDENVAEWTKKKGFPLIKDFSPKALVSRYHTQCLSTDQERSHPKQAKLPLLHQPGEGLQEDKSTSTKLTPPAPVPRPWTVYMGLQPERPPMQPDLQGSVTVWKDGGGISTRPHWLATKWDGSLRQAPDVPLDVLERVMFPQAFPSRIATPRSFEPRVIEKVQRLAFPQERSKSPWTEVAMHLVEVFEPGHY